MKGYNDFRIEMRNEYLKTIKSKKEQWLIEFAKGFLGIKGDESGCIICGDVASAKGLCQNHYHGWLYNNKTHGTSLDSYILWKNNTKKNENKLLQDE